MQKILLAVIALSLFSVAPGFGTSAVWHETPGPVPNPWDTVAETPGPVSNPWDTIAETPGPVPNPWDTIAETPGPVPNPWDTLAC